MGRDSHPHPFAVFPAYIFLAPSQQSERLEQSILTINKRSKIDWFVSEELCYCSTVFNFKICLLPEKLPGLSRNRPLIQVA